MMISDPNILASMLNMKLRDNQGEDLDDICASMDLDKYQVIDELAKAGFKFDAASRRFI